MISIYWLNKFAQLLNAINNWMIVRMHLISYLRNTNRSIQNRQIDINLKSIWFHIEILQVFLNTNNVNFL